LRLQKLCVSALTPSDINHINMFRARGNSADQLLGALLWASFLRAPKLCVSALISANFDIAENLFSASDDAL
jgi:hypothetical protein